jgi:hypothetical protein
MNKQIRCQQVPRVVHAAVRSIFKIFEQRRTACDADSAVDGRDPSRQKLPVKKVLPIASPRHCEEPLRRSNPAFFPR